MKLTIPFVILTLVLSACSFPFSAPTLTPTATFTAIPTAVPPSDTPLPTDTLAPPTEPPPPPTATTAPPTPAIPTAVPTHTRVPTLAVATPLPRARFDATFTNGTFVFRISERSNMVIPKSVSVRDGRCKEGFTFSDTVTFEPVLTYPIVDSKFSINYQDIVIVTGQFFSSTTAQGSITLYLKSGGKNCTIGPLPWRATGA